MGHSFPITMHIQLFMESPPSGLSLRREWSLSLASVHALNAPGERLTARLKMLSSEYSDHEYLTQPALRHHGNKPFMKAMCCPHCPWSGCRIYSTIKCTFFPHSNWSKSDHIWTSIPHPPSCASTCRMGGHIICTWVATHFRQHYSKVSYLDLSVARVKVVSNFPKLRKQSRRDMSDIRGKYSWRIFTKVPSNNSFPIPFALVTTILLCCDHVFVRKIVCKINQTKSHGLFSNQSSDGHWETCFHLFWYSDCNYQIIVQWHRYR